MRPVPAGRQRGQCCTPYSRLQEEIDNVETIAVTANNTANNAANAANTAVNTANSAAADAATALAGLTDGSVTQIGTSNVGTDTKPIKLVGGVPTIVINDLVDTATAQTVGGAKTYTGQQIATGQRAYDPANTDDIATIGTLDAYTPMVRTTGNQGIGGNKAFTGITTFSAGTWMRMYLQNNAVKISQTDSPDHSFDIRFNDVDGNTVAVFQLVCGSSTRYFRVGISNLNGQTTWTTLASVTL